MSIYSDAAKVHIEGLLRKSYGEVVTHSGLPGTSQLLLSGKLVIPQKFSAFREYRFSFKRRWRFDWAVPCILCANHYRLLPPHHSLFSLVGVIELQGGLFVKGAHANPKSIRSYYEKLNCAAALGWRVWQYVPEQVIISGRKTMDDEPVLKKLPWL